VDEDAAARYDRLHVVPAGVVDEPRVVPADAAVDHEPVLDVEEKRVKRDASLVTRICVVRVNALAGVLEDARPSRNRIQCEEPATVDRRVPDLDARRSLPGLIAASPPTTP
jgi:hypothetical protein